MAKNISDFQKWQETQDYEKKRLDLVERRRREALRLSKKPASWSSDENSGKMNFGRDSGGYIIINMADDRKSLFHDVLKGFEDYARLRGYRVEFSIDGSVPNEIAFRFTIPSDGIVVSTEQVRKDLREYIQRVNNGDTLDDLPIVLSEIEHQTLLLSMRNRISFLHHNYQLQQNALRFYESLMLKLAEKGDGIGYAPTFNVQGSGFMANKDQRAINSPQAAVGDHATVRDNIFDQSIRIGDSADEKKRRVDEIAELIKLLDAHGDGPEEAKKNAVKYLGKVEDEMKDEENPDKSRIGKWLEKAKEYMVMIENGSEIVKLAAKLFNTFGI
jgi:hypothetical protein